MLLRRNFKTLLIALAALSLGLALEASAQTKKTDSKKSPESKAKEDKALEDAKAAKMAEEAKALEEAKKAEEAKKTETPAASNGVLGYIKDKFSASYHGEFYFVRRDITSANKDDHDLQDFNVMHNPTIIYRPFTNWKLLATSEFKYTDTEPAAAPYPDRHYRSLILITRENILTQKDNGIKLDAGIGRRIFDRLGLPSTYGNSRVNVTVSRKVNDKLSVSSLVQYLANDPAKGQIGATTWKHSLELIPTVNYQITDKLSYFFNDDFIINTAWFNNSPNEVTISHEMNVGVFSYQFTDAQSAYFQLKYLHTEDFRNAPGNPRPNSDYFDYYIGYTYAITPKFSVTPEIGSTLFKARDGRDFFAKNVEYPELALYVDASF